METIQDVYNSPVKFNEDFLNSARQKSFESIVKAPYHSPHDIYNPTRSIESPYTSLGSGRSSYASIKPTSYSSLRAKSIRANAQHESKSKAVMKALQNLQSKIGALEVDRAKAENNLKTLTLETTEYKELLKQKHDLTTSTVSPCSTRRNSHSEELEGQLENAQGRCEVLEKQLEYMRKIMQGEKPSYPSPSATPQRSQRPSVSSSSPNYSITSAQHLRNRTQPIASPKKDDTGAATRLKTVEESPALEKLNGLEKEHMKLSASQTQAECKIRELEEKIREESHCRKLLEDKAYELEQAVAQTQSNDAKLSPEYVDQKPKRTKKRKVKKAVSKKPTSTSSSSKQTTPRSPRHQSPRYQSQHHPMSSTHYHLDLANIPFVVGQSTSRSHSVGANLQNVLSIMKSHSKLCDGGAGDVHVVPSPRNKSRSPRSPKSRNDLQQLLGTLTGEFEQLGDEHRMLSEKLKQDQSEIVQKNHEREMARIIEKMETKGKQITTIRDVLRSNPVLNNRKEPSGGRIKFGSQEIQVVTTIRAPKPIKATTESQTNTNLELLKKVKKLQYTLQKGDLQWD